MKKDMTNAENIAEFWTRFNEKADSEGVPFRTNKANGLDNKAKRYDIFTGTAGAVISMDAVNTSHFVRISLLINDDKELYDKLFVRKSDIMEALPYPITFNRKDGNKRSTISTLVPGLDYDDKSNYDTIISWLLSVTTKFYKVFRPMLEQYK